MNLEWKRLPRAETLGLVELYLATMPNQDTNRSGGPSLTIGVEHQQIVLPTLGCFESLQEWENMHSHGPGRVVSSAPAHAEIRFKPG